MRMDTALVRSKNSIDAMVHILVTTISSHIIE